MPPSRVTIITEVDLIRATASMPTCRPISSTASAVITATIWLSPTCISTWAMMPSCLIAVMRPGSRLRALRRGACSSFIGKLLLWGLGQQHGEVQPDALPLIGQAQAGQRLNMVQAVVQTVAVQKEKGRRPAQVLA